MLELSESGGRLQILTHADGARMTKKTGLVTFSVKLMRNPLAALHSPAAEIPLAFLWSGMCVGEISHSRLNHTAHEDHDLLKAAYQPVMDDLVGIKEHGLQVCLLSAAALTVLLIRCRRSTQLSACQCPSSPPMTTICLPMYRY